MYYLLVKELGGPAVNALCAITKVKQRSQRSSDDQKFIISSTILATFAIVTTHHPAIGSRDGYGPFLCVIHKEGLCPSSGNINKLMMMMMMMIYWALMFNTCDNQLELTRCRHKA
jgi:hypothetical protein